MRCFETEAELVDLLDGRLDGAGELAVHAHLEGCAECRRRADAWGRLVPLMRGLAPAPPSPLRARRMEVEIERLLLERPAARRTAAPRVFAWGGLALAAAAALALTWRARVERERPALRVEIVAVEGGALAGAAPAVAGAWLDGPGALAVDEHGVVSLAVASASLKVEGPARLALAGESAHVSLRLDAGTLTATVAHRAPGATFVVATPDGRVEVRGTRFAVTVGPSGSTVAVEEGRVAVFAAGGIERSVAKGERASFGAGGFVAAPVAPATSLAPPAASSPPGSGAEPPRPCPPAGPSCATVARQVRASMRAGQRERALRMIEGELGAGCEAAPSASACGAELRYLRAEALREEGRLDDAVAAYKGLDRRAAPAATRQNALYAAAQLELRLGRAAAARADFEGALAAAPAGALREEALLGAMESAAAAGDARGARSLAARYLSLFPSGLGAKRAHAFAESGASTP